MKINYLAFLLAFTACNTNTTDGKPEPTPTKSQDTVQYQTPQLSLEQANNLAELPLACVNQEYPNKLSQTLGDAGDLKEPSVLHPAFYGCFDWHSAVHGHWSMVYLLKNFPELAKAETLKSYLKQHLTKENIQAEVAYFNGEHNKSYERTYGWAWFLKLAEELHTWDDPLARELEQNMQPLTDLLVERYEEFLPKLNYPVRVGEHPNTAFGMSFAYEYAQTVTDTTFQKLLADRARDFYSKDTDCPISWEPGGTDFLSPCLEELNMMRLVLPKDEFLEWAGAFLPQLSNTDYELAVGEVSDRTDGKLVHLDGVNFSRAWNLYALANQYPEYAHLKAQADKHLSYSLPNVVGDDYEGGHWLGSFALYALKTAQQ
ncbi:MULTISPECIES: DUF2891 domain-containing protein [unclassified Leeuwenhoekiella]|uniref:DUF2891 domain-containing protein n=1 Tax=unclassified Leeuwenhoekiella TaxID=2615029 RepID=UPI000C4B94DD|nr:MULTISPECIES: DUF2891 domain-containing protein [unclassified Leeuwenhoekiella]MAW94513.1 hypothetical protein [Leeuwenhoekiella sp.]MBA81936.1 hypothetical protein [Leeuwenhoekiella sp.]|tara:strand:- start:2181 stop:3299 length:1119 start_codon:yes stop_codon:yes gene_type:complete